MDNSTDQSGQLPITANSMQSTLETKAHIIIYTGGSATGGTTARDAAMVATVGDPDDSDFIHSSKIRGSELTSSYEEEEAVLLLALGWARANCPTERRSICSDSQALFKAIHSDVNHTQSIQKRLHHPHLGIPGNLIH